MITSGSFLVGGLVGFFAILVVGFLFVYFKNCKAFTFLFQPFWKIFMFTFRNVLKCQVVLTQNQSQSILILKY